MWCRLAEMKKWILCMNAGAVLKDSDTRDIGVVATCSERWIGEQGEVLIAFMY